MTRRATSDTIHTKSMLKRGASDGTKQISGGCLLYTSSSDVKAVDQKYNEPARLWCNEEWVTAGCLRCTDPRCMKFIDAEISCRHFPDFSYERDLNVCPVGAIKWNFDKELPEIDNHSCIGCGLCAARCPIGAIYKSENQMKIAEPSSDYDDIPINHVNLEAHKLFIRELDLSLIHI